MITAWAHRAWIAVEPCERRELPGGNPALEQLAFRHEQELRRFEGAHKMLQASALIAAEPSQRAAVVDKMDGDFARQVAQIGRRQHDEMLSACRQSP